LIKKGVSYLATEAQKKATKKYKQKVKRFTVDFYPTEDELWEHIQQQPKKQTYIKHLIQEDMQKSTIVRLEKELAELRARATK
jgi:hypothetical protein